MHVYLAVMCSAPEISNCLQFVAIVSSIIGFLTLTEHGHWTAPDVPIVRQVVGGLQFVVTLAALIAVILAALGLKPGGSHLLLLVSVCVCVCVYTVLCHTPARCAFGCLVMRLPQNGPYCVHGVLPLRAFRHIICHYYVHYYVQ